MRISFCVFAIILLSISCKHTADQQQKPNEVAIREKLIDLNKERITEENEQIDAYISRLGYQMSNTKTGVRYLILKNGTGKNAEWLSEVKLKYKLELLDGTYCYSSDSSGIMDIKLGQSNEPTGLQEGILNLNTGAKALLVVPSYRAYGLTGDGNKITGAQSLVYHVELIETK